MLAAGSCRMNTKSTHKTSWHQNYWNDKRIKHTLKFCILTDGFTFLVFFEPFESHFLELAKKTAWTEWSPNVCRRPRRRRRKHLPKVPMQVLRSLGLDRWIWLNMYISFFLGGYLWLAKNKPSMSLMEIGIMDSNSSKLRNVRLGGRLCAVAKSFAGVAWWSGHVTIFHRVAAETPGILAPGCEGEKKSAKPVGKSRKNKSKATWWLFQSSSLALVCEGSICKLKRDFVQSVSVVLRHLRFVASKILSIPTRHLGGLPKEMFSYVLAGLSLPNNLNMWSTDRKTTDR